MHEDEVALANSANDFFMEMKAMDVKLTVVPEGRIGIWLPDKDSLKTFIKNRKLKAIHNFSPLGNLLLGADHDVSSVLADIDAAERVAVFTDKSANMGHSLALIQNNKLECYDIGAIDIDELNVKGDESNGTSERNDHH